MMCKKQEKQVSVVKIAVISAGIVIAAAAAMAVLYRLFTKHFKITFDCGDDCCCGDSDCDVCGSECDWGYDCPDSEPECAIDSESDNEAADSDTDTANDDSSDTTEL